MLKVDIDNLDRHEREVLEEAFKEGSSARRTRGILLSSATFLVGLALFVAFGAGVIFLAGLTVATIAVAAWEKYSYQRTMVTYETVIRKLVNRLEVAEGVPQSDVVGADSAPAVNLSDAPGNEAKPVHLSEADYPTQAH